MVQKTVLTKFLARTFTFVVVCAVVVIAAGTHAQAEGWQTTLDPRHDQFVSHPGGKVTATSCNEDDLHPIAAVTYGIDGNVTGEVGQPFWSCNFPNSRTKTAGPDGVIYGVQKDIQVPHRPQTTFAVQAFKDGTQLWNHMFHYHPQCWGSEPQVRHVETGANGNLYTHFHRGEGWCQGLETTKRLAILDPTDGSTLFYGIDEGEEGSLWYDNIKDNYYHQSGLVRGEALGNDYTLYFEDEHGQSRSAGVVIEDTHGVSINGSAPPMVNINPEGLIHIAQGSITLSECQKILQVTDAGIQNTIDLPVCGQTRSQTSAPWGSAWAVEVHDSQPEDRYRIITLDKDGQLMNSITLPEQYTGSRESRPNVLSDMNGNLIVWQPYSTEVAEGEFVPDVKIMVINPQNGAVIHQRDTKDLDSNDDVGFFTPNSSNLAIADNQVYLLGDECRRVVGAPVRLGRCEESLSWQLLALPVQGVDVDYPRGALIAE